MSIDYEKIISDLTEKNTKFLSEEVSNEEKQLSKYEEYAFENPHEAVQLRSLIQDIQERKSYASKIFFMVVGWLIIILAIIILGGIETNNGRILKISDTVILALIGSTTINITTFFVIVTKYLFPSNQLKD